MINLEHTEKFSEWDKHKTWVRVGAGMPRTSSLQNQFALHEFHMGESEAVARYRGWLWEQMKDRYSVVSKEMRELAGAHLAGERVEVWVTKYGWHGQMLVNALLWLASTLPPMPPEQVNATYPSSCYEPIIEEGVVSLRGEVGSQKIVWIKGNTQSCIGVIVGWNEVLVPGYGVLTLKNFDKNVRWADEKLTHYSTLQEELNDELDQMFDAELETPVAYDAAPSFETVERYKQTEEDLWEQSPIEELDSMMALVQAEADSMTQVEQLAEEFGDIDTALEVAGVPDIEEWYAKRPPLSPYLDGKTIKTVFIHKGDNSPLMFKSPEDQIAGKRFRYAKKTEMEEYRKTFRTAAGQKT